MLIIFIAFICSFPLYAQESKCNCCTDNHEAFDFWIGSWEVTNRQGKVAGTNRIERIQGNCVLQENWKGANGAYTGTSNNFFNDKTKQWEQIWFDNQGQTLHLKGKRIGNQMILQSEEKMNRDGKPYINRITWTKNDDGTVRQLWEIITNGTDATVAFDGLYKKNQ